MITGISINNETTTPKDSHDPTTPTEKKLVVFIISDLSKIAIRIVFAKYFSTPMFTLLQYFPTNSIKYGVTYFASSITV